MLEGLDSCPLPTVKARGRCLRSLLRQTNGRELGSSRLLLYTDDDGKACLLARQAEIIARKKQKQQEQGVGGGAAADTTSNNKALRSFFSVVGDVMLDKTTQWATGELLRAGLWSKGGALAGDIAGCGFRFRWGPGVMEGSGHSHSVGVCATTSVFELEYIGEATDGDSHKRLPDLVRQTNAMVADLEECRTSRGGESWAFGEDGGGWLPTDSSKCAARRVVESVGRMRDDTHVRLSGAVFLVVNGILEANVRGRAEGVGAVYMLVAAFRGLVACSVGNRVVGVRLLSQLCTGAAASVSCLRESSLSLVTSLNVDSTIAEVGAMSPVEVERAILSEELLSVFGPGYGIGVSGDRCVLDLASSQRSHPAEGIIELGGSMLPDLSDRYGDRETLLFGRTVVSKREAGTRVAFVRDPVATNLVFHYATTEVGGFEMSSLSMLLGALNLTYLTVTSENASLFRTWIYPTLWSRVCSCSHDAVQTTHSVIFGYAPRSVLAWNMAATAAVAAGRWGGTNNGPVLSSAALYMATEIIGKQTGSYAGDFGCWCKALDLRRVPETESGIIADAPLVLSKCKVWQTTTGEAIRLVGKNRGYLRLTRGANFDHVVQDEGCAPNTVVVPREEPVRLGARVEYY